MENRAMLFKKICEIDFAIHELTLYLDTHPDSKRALELLNKFRAYRKEAVAEYEKNYGQLVITSCDAGKNGKWEWIDSPWPWENEFMGG